MQRPLSLSDENLKQLAVEGDRFTTSSRKLCKTLVNAADKHAGEITCLLDAIDECEDSGRLPLQALCRLIALRGTVT